MPRPNPLIAGQIIKRLEQAEEGAVAALAALYPKGTDLGEKAHLCIDALEAFIQRFGNGPVRVARSAGRINLLGMHVEHRGGHVNPMAIGDAFFVFQPREDDEVRMCDANTQFPPRRFSIRQEMPENVIEDWDAWTQQAFEERKARGDVGDWSNYVKAPVLYFQHLYTDEDGRFAPVLTGMNLAVASNVPRCAGLGSSSCMVMGAEGED